MPVVQQLPPGFAKLFLRGRHMPGAAASNTSADEQAAQEEFAHFVEDVLGIQVREARRATPTTLVGSVLLPALAALGTVAVVLYHVAPSRYADIQGKVQSASNHAVLQKALRGVTAVRGRLKLTNDRMTTICVACYFLHEGFAAWQVKWAQLSQSLVPIRTPFGLMRMVPKWHKGDAVDIVLLVTAFCTGANLLPEVGLCLLLVDVVTDCIDMLAQLFIRYLLEGSFGINELMAKKVSLLGVMILVTLYQWQKRGGGPSALSSVLDEDGDEDSSTIGSAALLVGRTLMAALFFHCALNELGRLYLSDESYDIDPGDGHNVVWPKVVELLFAVPLVVGWQTRHASRLLATTLLLEALSVWQFWRVDLLELRLHSREHFAVNVAVAGGLLLLQNIGGGRFTVEELLKKAS